MVKKSLLMIFSLIFSIGIMNAQTHSVSGVVLEKETGDPIIGASVLVKGTGIGSSTDKDGRFVIKSAPTNAKLIMVSYVGMKTIDVPISSDMKIELESDSRMIDDVIVVAYGTAKKSSYSGSASFVKSDEIKDLPTTSFESALNGKVSGLQVTTSSGEAGSAPTIHIRGIGSMNASSEPLYVIDGVPVISGSIGQMESYTYTSNNVMNSLNPEDIESISVLKDAAASSLYGSRAANGVILITTKKGKLGKPTVNLKASVGFTPSWATKNYETASTQEQVNMLYQVFHDYRTSSGKTEEDANTYALGKLNSKFNKHGYAFTTDNTGLYENVNILDYDNSGRAGTYYDWDKAYFRTAMYNTYDLSVSGATTTTNYYTSLAYTKDQGRIKVNSFDRYSGRINLEQKIGKFFEIASNVSLAQTNQQGYNDTRTTGSNYFFQTRNLLWGLYWPTDYKTGDDWTARYGSYAYNGLYYDTQWENSSLNTRITASESATLHLFKGFDLRSIFSYDNTTVKDHVYYSALHFTGASQDGVVNEMRTAYQSLVSSTTANYTTQFGLNSLGAMVGFEASENTTDYVRATGNNLPTSTLHTVATAGTQTSNAYNWGNSMLSYLSKIDYNYSEKYYASASLRRDGSSKLYKYSRWGNFWSLAGSWRLTNESFMQPLKKTLSELKLRASYGVNGTLPVNNYGYMSLITYTSKYMGDPGATISTVSNGNLSWETSYTYNLGIDFGLFGNKLRGTIEYFNRDSKNLLQDVPISLVTGFSSTLQNFGSINNHGLEVELSGEIINKNGWNWSAGINAAFVSSKVTKLYDGADIIWYDPTGGDARAQYLYRQGESTLAFYGYEWAGVDKTNGKSVYYVNDTENNQTGDFVYNGRGATYDYKNANYTIIGNAIPTVSGGINTQVSYLGIDLGLNFIYKLGGQLYDGAYKDVADDGYYWERTRAESYYQNLWTPTNTNGTEPLIRGTDLTDPQQFSSRHISSASFVRLKTLSLGYNLPKILYSKALMSSARLFVNVSNPWTFATYKEADPEVNQYGTRGWETPIGKTYVFGIDIKF